MTDTRDDCIGLGVNRHCLYCGGPLSKKAVARDNPLHPSCRRTLAALDDMLDDDRGRESGGALPSDDEDPS